MIEAVIGFVDERDLLDGERLALCGLAAGIELDAWLEMMGRGVGGAPRVVERGEVVRVLSTWGREGLDDCEDDDEDEDEDEDDFLRSFFLICDASFAPWKNLLCSWER